MRAGRFTGQIIECEQVVYGPAEVRPDFEVAPRTIARFGVRVRRS